MYCRSCGWERLRHSNCDFGKNATSRSCVLLVSDWHQSVRVSMTHSWMRGEYRRSVSSSTHSPIRFRTKSSIACIVHSNVWTFLFVDLAIRHNFTVFIIRYGLLVQDIGTDFRLNLSDKVTTNEYKFLLKDKPRFGRCPRHIARIIWPRGSYKKASMHLIGAPVFFCNPLHPKHSHTAPTINCRI